MTATRTYRLGVIGGDGIGPEVTGEALKVLEVVGELAGIIWEIRQFPYSDAHFRATGELLPANGLAEMRRLDAILLGAVGRIGDEQAVRGIVLGLRRELDLYVNLRPVKGYTDPLIPLKGRSAADIDMLFVRENTEDIYAGQTSFMHLGTTHEVATTQAIYTRFGVERCLRYAFELAARSGRRGKLTLVDKANVIRAHELWRRTLDILAAEYPQVKTEALYVDAAAMLMISDPARFDVVVTTNLFGDILTDLGAALQGGMGLAGSANLHPGRVSMFEPIHGTAPDIAGTSRASPLAAIIAAALLLEHLGESQAAQTVQQAVEALLRSRRIPSADARSGLSTTRQGEMVCEEVRKMWQGA